MDERTVTRHAPPPTRAIVADEAFCAQAAAWAQNALSAKMARVGDGSGRVTLLSSISLLLMGRVPGCC